MSIEKKLAKNIDFNECLRVFPEAKAPWCLFLSRKRDPVFGLMIC
jgi:hypothetical protein